ncbi:ATG10 enzyme, partial [Polypterus senegalus]|nr:ATG10 enzyme [Polypterus senegalus]
MKKVILKMKNAFGYAIPEQQKIVNEKTYRQEFEVQDTMDLEELNISSNDLSGREMIRFEYHVVYSSSYQVPVLYFRACNIDGRPLTLEEIWQSVHENYKERLLEGPWETITQQEHPLLGQPFFILHPCRSHELMTPILKSAREEKRSVNYITAWLSMMGPVLGLNLPISYTTATSAQQLD